MTTTLRLSLTTLAIALAAACGSGDIGNGQPGPCDVLPPAPECADECNFDSDCAAGFFCGTDGTCDADCTPGGNECGDGATCDPTGRCIADQPDGGNNGCPEVFVNATPETPYVMLLIDQSGSMTESFGGTDRWTAVTDALVDSTDGVVAQLDDRVIFGAALYSSINGNTEGGTCPLLDETPPAIDNYANINDLIRAGDPIEDTPTAESITAVTAGFPLPDPERPGPRILVLATDGNPDNCDDPDAHDLGSQQMSEQAVQTAYSDGIKTFVLSVGDDVAVPHLQKLANAGIGAPLDGNEGTFYVANNPDELVAAFDEIIRGTRTCTFELDGNVDLARADEGNVSLNGTPLEYGTDWQLVDDDTLELLGDACDTFLESDEVTLEASFPCGVVVL